MLYNIFIFTREHDMETIETFVKRLNAEVAADPFFTEAKYATGRKYSIDLRGRKYTKIIMTDLDGTGASVWGFIEKATGNIFKAAGWKAPAKHARGHIDSAVYGKHYHWTGPAYLK